MKEQKIIIVDYNCNKNISDLMILMNDGWLIVNTLRLKDAIVHYVLEKDINIKKRNVKKETKKSYGEYGHVKFTNEEFEKLKNDFQDYEDWIRRVDEYLEQNPKKKYTNFYLVIKKWRDKEQKNNFNRRRTIDDIEF